MDKETVPAAITLEAITDLINNALNGFDKRNKKDLNTLSEKLNSLTTTKEEPIKDTTVPANKTVDPGYALLQKQVADLTKATEEAKSKAAKAEMNNELSKVLSTFTFASDYARETAYKTFGSDIQQTADGQYVIGDEPLASGIKSRMNQLPGLLAPKGISGTGANSGNSQVANPGMQIEDIKPGLTADQYKNIGLQLQKLF